MNLYKKILGLWVLDCQIPNKEQFLENHIKTTKDAPVSPVSAKDGKGIRCRCGLWKSLPRDALMICGCRALNLSWLLFFASTFVYGKTSKVYLSTCFFHIFTTSSPSSSLAIASTERSHVVPELPEILWSFAVVQARAVAAQNALNPQNI